MSGHCAELMLNSKADEDKSYAARVMKEKDGACEIFPYDKKLYGGLGNLHISEGNAGGRVFKFKCKKRTNMEQASLPQMIRKGLNDMLDSKKLTKKAIGMSGVYKILNGKVKTHVQPDYFDCPEAYYDEEQEKAVKSFLRFYDKDEAMGPELI